MAEPMILAWSRPAPSLLVVTGTLPEPVLCRSTPRRTLQHSLVRGATATSEPLDVLVIEVGPEDRGEALTVSAGGGEVVLTTEMLAGGASSRELLSAGAASLTRADRAAVMEALLDAAEVADVADAPALSRWLHDMNQGLRERFPLAVIDRSADPAIAVEVVASIDPNTFLVRGWAAHPSEAIRSLVAISPEGERVEVRDDLWRFPRPDVEELYQHLPASPFGFLTTVETILPSRLDEGWTFQLIHADGSMECSAPRVLGGQSEVRRLLLGELALEDPADDELRRRHIVPGIERLQAARSADFRAEWIDQWGQTPSDPDVSIVVPLYGRTDYVMHQLAQFVHDPELAEADLIYVLDQPEQAEAFRSEAGRLHRLYGVPFRVVAAAQNGGFALANNLGASVARGRLLLLLNSDVIPDRPGWLGRLVAFHDSTENVGAVAPKLVFEDESLQHAGMFFERTTAEDQWANEHYFKGMHRRFPPACVSRPVPAVSAACLLLTLELYRSVDGLGGSYIQGDYEDSDLCLRLAERGLRSWYCAEVELYHLEGQSYPTPERVLNGRINRWLHHERWEQRIAAMMAEPGTTPADVALLHGAR